MKAKKRQGENHPLVASTEGMITKFHAPWTPWTLLTFLPAWCVHFVMLHHTSKHKSAESPESAVCLCLKHFTITLLVRRLEIWLVFSNVIQNAYLLSVQFEWCYWLRIFLASQPPDFGIKHRFGPRRWLWRNGYRPEAPPPSDLRHQL